LNIYTEKIASIPDIVCKKSNGVIWMVEESKHINNTTYLQGDIQIICHMLSAIQYNNKNFKCSLPKTIFGLKFKNTKCFFYRINITDEYLKCLETGNFIENLYVYKYPENGIDINLYNTYENIEKVCNILHNLNIYASNI